MEDWAILVGRSARDMLLEDLDDGETVGSCIALEVFYLACGILTGLKGTGGTAAGKDDGVLHTIYIIRCSRIQGVFNIICYTDRLRCESAVGFIFDINDCPDHPLPLLNYLENVPDDPLRYVDVGSAWTCSGIVWKDTKSPRFKDVDSIND